jgi:hypothetical protein
MTLAEVFTKPARKVAPEPPSPFRRLVELLEGLAASLRDFKTLARPDDDARFKEALAIARPSETAIDKPGSNRELFDLINEIRAEASASISVEYKGDARRPERDPFVPTANRSIPAVTIEETRIYIADLIGRAIEDVRELEAAAKAREERIRKEAERRVEILRAAMAADPTLAALLELYTQQRSEISEAHRQVSEEHRNAPDVVARVNTARAKAGAGADELQTALTRRAQRVWAEHSEFKELPALSGYLVAALCRLRGLKHREAQTREGLGVTVEEPYTAKVKVL